MEQRLPDDDRRWRGGVAAHGAVFAVWLTAAIAVGGYANGYRYPGYYLLWTAVLMAGVVVVPRAVHQSMVQRSHRFETCGALAAAFCVLFAAALSLDLGPTLRAAPRLGAARLLLLG